MTERERGPGAEIGDGQIINATDKEPGEGGKIRFSIHLKGRDEPLTSDWFPASETGKMMGRWISAVREQVNADYFAKQEELKEKRLRAQRDAEMGEPRPEVTVSVAAEAAVAATDPSSYVTTALERAFVAREQAEIDLRRASEQAKTARKNYREWKKIAKGLNIDVQPKDQTGNSDEAELHSDSGIPDGQDGVHDTPVPGTDESAQDVRKVPEPEGSGEGPRETGGGRK